MAFNPTVYVPPEPKPLPVILLLDVSSSMRGAKIDRLNEAVRDMVESFAKEEQKETIIHVSIITFGEKVIRQMQYTPVRQLKLPQMAANGMTPMGTALRMAKDIIEDRDETPSRSWAPAVLLVSDGEPTDDWRGPLDSFISSGRSSKCERFGIPIGKEANRQIIRMFAQDDGHMFEAENADDIASVFKKVTMTVSKRSQSKNPNDIPKADRKFDGTASGTRSQPKSAPADDDDDPEF